MLIPTSCLCGSVLFFSLLTGGEHWSCCKAFSVSQISSCVICKSGSDGGITWKVSWFICGCFPDPGSQESGSGIVILGRERRNTQLGYCPGSRSAFDCILRKIKSERLYPQLPRPGRCAASGHGSWLVLVCLHCCDQIPQTGGFYTGDIHFSQFWRLAV